MNGTERKSVHSVTKVHQDERPSILLMLGKELGLSEKLGFFFSLHKSRLIVQSLLQRKAWTQDSYIPPGPDVEVTLVIFQMPLFSIHSGALMGNYCSQTSWCCLQTQEKDKQICRACVLQSHINAVWRQLAHLTTCSYFYLSVKHLTCVSHTQGVDSQDCTICTAN